MGCHCTKNTNGSDIRDYYKIGVVLGSGSFGQVRNCVKKSTDEVFAVKIMSKDPPKEKRGSNNVDFASMFRNEVSLLTSLSHPNVIKFYEYYEDRLFLYAIMDKCEGGELFAHIVKKRRFSEREAAELCFQMLKAIQYVHSCGIVHRDVKAENFLFCDRSTNSRLVLIDFGMSTRISDERSLKQLCGSPHYVAPELIRRSYRFKVDMWALGVVVFLMLYGKYPFEGSDQKAIVQSILNGQPDYLKPPRAPSNLAVSFMNSLLEKCPDQRLGPDQALRHPWILLYSQESASTQNYLNLSNSSKRHIIQINTSNPCSPEENNDIYKNNALLSRNHISSSIDESVSYKQIQLNPQGQSDESQYLQQNEVETQASSALQQSVIPPPVRVVRRFRYASSGSIELKQPNNNISQQSPNNNYVSSPHKNHIQKFQSQTTNGAAQPNYCNGEEKLYYQEDIEGEWSYEQQHYDKQDDDEDHEIYAVNENEEEYVYS